ncbi:ATP-binding protein [Scytonema sp. NUACC26]|uniref:ATP-binding protein n=1 Tax=Scytonema sp. NUACC26 TaxID=3140176 RepID=UPI0034DBC451
MNAGQLGTIAEEVFVDGGEMGSLMRSHQWSQTALGSVEHWSQSLKIAANICLNSQFPMVIWWGDELTLLYNDAWRPILGNKHPQALGKPGQEVWSEIWDIVGTQLRSVLKTGKATWSDDQLLLVNRYGYTEEAYFTYSYSPIFLETGEVGGAFTAVAETTKRVVGERRLATLRNLAEQTGQSKTVEQAYKMAMQTLSENSADIPLALIYELDSEGTKAVLQEQTPLIHPLIAPVELDLRIHDNPLTRSLASVVQSGQPSLIENIVQQWGEFPVGASQIPLQQAMVLPIRASTQDSMVGMLVIGINLYQALDEGHYNFLEMTTGHIANAIASTRAYEEERKRAEALAELDRAKTTFFSNVSHEFRTPLTLMLSPLEEILATDSAIPYKQRQQLELVHRNSLRLLKLVNTLLDFSRIEAGRVQAVYEPTDLAQLTAELASVFRCAIEQAGLQWIVACEPLSEPVYVDRQMWEKIILNLLSNAFKFTFSGTISLTLRKVQNQIELTVCDTGIGIPKTELPRLFERFYRIEGARGRTQEGSGIGLALVQELTRLHGGQVQVESIEGEGTTFTVTIPCGTAHLPSDRIQATQTLDSTALGAAPYVEEALRWLPDEDLKLPVNFQWDASGTISDPQEGNWTTNNPQSKTQNSKSKILLVDDNTDMRSYVRRLLLSQGYEVETASDGIAALATIGKEIPDLVLTDVMMPHLDGFGLLRELRATPITREVPIVLLSARAGEEACVEGLGAGADDYLIKPFSTRELLARVEASLKLSQLRREAQQREQRLRIEAEAAKQNVETILSSIRDSFLVLDCNWCYTYVNTQLCTMTGIPRSTLLGRNIWDLFSDVVDTKVYVQFHQAMAEQTPVQFEYFYPTWNRWFEYRVYPSPNALTVFVAEISDRKQSEAERELSLQREQAARSEAERANRIKDEFLAILSHELRSPLNPILGWSKLLQTGKLDLHASRHALETIERNAKLQTQLIDDLLDVSRMLRGKMALNISPVNLVTIIESAIETVRLATEAKHIQIQTVLTLDNVEIAGDLTRLQQIVWNLLSNAVKFTPEGGSIEVSLNQIGTTTQIQVKDTGKGISPDFLPYVFDYFRQEDGTTTRKFGGLGLGLAIVRHLTELHGGTVHAESLGEGLGATFTVMLPLMTVATESNQEITNAPQTADFSNLHIIAVDDNEDMRNLVQVILEQQGAQVSAAASAAEVLLLFDRQPPDILISDIGMPKTDGYMLMQQIRSRSPERGGLVPAIALTAYAGEYDQQQALKSGFYKHIPKPVEPEVLVSAIASLIAGIKV